MWQTAVAAEIQAKHGKARAAAYKIDITDREKVYALAKRVTQEVRTYARACSTERERGGGTEKERGGAQRKREGGTERERESESKGGSR